MEETNNIKNNMKAIIGALLLIIGVGVYIFLQIQPDKYPEGSTVYEIVEGDVPAFEEKIEMTIIPPGEGINKHGLNFGSCTNGGFIKAKVRTNGYSTTTLSVLDATCH